MIVAELLAASRAAHDQYKANLPRMTPTGVGGVAPSAGNPVDAKRYLTEAKRLRQEAQDADPSYADPAWAAEPVPHAEIMAFYQAVGA